MEATESLVRLKTQNMLTAPAFVHEEKSFMSVMKSAFAKGANLGMCWLVEGGYQNEFIIVFIFNMCSPILLWCLLNRRRYSSGGRLLLIIFDGVRLQLGDVQRLYSLGFCVCVRDAVQLLQVRRRL